MSNATAQEDHVTIPGHVVRTTDQCVPGYPGGGPSVLIRTTIVEGLAEREPTRREVLLAEASQLDHRMDVVKWNLLQCPCGLAITAPDSSFLHVLSRDNEFTASAPLDRTCPLRAGTEPSTADLQRVLGEYMQRAWVHMDHLPREEQAAWSSWAGSTKGARETERARLYQSIAEVIGFFARWAQAGLLR